MKWLIEGEEVKQHPPVLRLGRDDDGDPCVYLDDSDGEPLHGINILFSFVRNDSGDYYAVNLQCTCDGIEKNRNAEIAFH